MIFLQSRERIVKLQWDNQIKSQGATSAKRCLEVDLDGRSHGGLDEDLTNVLPLLLQKTGKEVSRKLGVDNDVLGFHVTVSDGNVQAHNLLHLELDGGLDFVNLLLHVFSTGDEGGELTGLGKTGTQKTRDLLDHVVGSQEEIVTLGKLLHQLLVLVELLQILNTHVIDTDTVSLFTVSSVSKNTALHLGLGNGGELEGSGETFITDGVVVFQSDLNLDGFGEVTLLSLLVLSVDMDILSSGKAEDVFDSLVKNSRVKLRHGSIFNGLLPSL